MNAPETPRPLFAGYRPPDGAYDEAVDAYGNLRPHWQGLAATLDAVGVEGFGRRVDEARRLLRENGVTYNIYGDPGGVDRTLELDPVPAVIDPAEWRVIEAGLIQRAQLLNLILADVYGPQKLLRETLLPPALVFAQAGFLRPCHGFRVPGNVHLHMLGVELARAPNGGWWILSDRSQSPSGAGYALENRSVLLRTMPDTFRDCRVSRLAPYFQALRETMVRVAPQNRDNPRIVLLTPGPFNETYFEHAYLARHLGYILAQGEDLTVRDNLVYLKTVQGLRRIDVIVRRLDDDFCDPLELRSESMLGVPGLVQAARAGGVAIANPLGSGIAGAAGLLPFLPGLCRHLLGEDLLLPSVATWWCGQEYARDEALKRIESLVFKPAFPDLSFEPIFGSQLDAAGRASLEKHLRARPHELVAQETVAVSTCPAWTGNGIEPRRLLLRAHLVARGDSYCVMPGGFARISALADSHVVSMQRGGGSKDAWVLATESEPQAVAPILTLAPVELSRGDRDLPSRVADHLFWLGRYVERAELTARLARCLLKRLTYESGRDLRPEVVLLAGPLAEKKLVDLSAANGDPSQTGDVLATLERGLLATVRDHDKPGQLGDTLHAIQRVATIVRDRISYDAWRILRRIEEEFASARQSPWFAVAGAMELLDRLIVSLSAFSGLGTESMTRGQGWRLLDMGRRIERSLETVRMIKHALVVSGARESVLLDALLEISDSQMTYRSRYRTGLQLAPVLDLILTDESNPRSLGFQIHALAKHVARLPRDPGRPDKSPEERLLLPLVTELQLVEIPELCIEDAYGRRRNLEVVLERFLTTLPAFSDALKRSYLTHAAATHQLTGIRSQATP